ncbi:MAG: signal peptidase I [Acidimicrobiaceae bacterium]|jgi:signal peptidase I|nr:signal peptidase I [Actinomycetota bacterium]
MSDTDQGESFAIEADGDDEPGGSTSLAALGRGAKAFFDWALVVVIALVVALGVRTFLLAHFVVEGSSMYSTLETGDRVFVNKVSYRLHDPNRGDVVVLHEIRGTTERDLIKRVIAVGGEEVEMRSCEVRIGGQLLIEPYLDPTVVTPGNCGGDFGPILVPEGTVFVMGDNRAGSQDSRTLGPVLLDDIVGRAFVVFWPRSNWQWL